MANDLLAVNYDNLVMGGRLFGQLLLEFFSLVNDYNLV